MALSYVTYAGDGVTTNFTFDKGYIDSSDVSVYLDGVLQTITTHYSWFSSTVIQFVTPPAGAAVVKIARSTESTTRVVDFQDAANLTESDLDTSALQMFYLAQESLDNYTDNALVLDTDDKYNATSKVIKNVADPSSAQDAATKAYGDANWGGAAVTAAEAAQAAAEAAQTAAETAETNAETAETGAVAAQAATETVYDNFDDRYLGSKASDPTLDNDGDALVTGALYFNSTDDVMRVYTGTIWQNTSAGSLTDSYSTTKGNILVGNGSAFTELGVGTNDYTLAAASGEATGVIWTPPTYGWDYINEIIVGTGATDSLDLAAAGFDDCLEVEITFADVSASTTSWDLLLRLGATSTLVTTGYFGMASDHAGTTSYNTTAGVPLNNQATFATDKFSGWLKLTRHSTGTTWRVTGTGFEDSTGNPPYTIAGSINLSATTLGIIGLHTTAGVFDGGWWGIKTRS